MSYLDWTKFSRWWGIGILPLIAVSIGAKIFEMVRAKRFGLKHVEPKGLTGSIIGLAMIAVFFYGWFRYPDAPLHPCSDPSGYCGKQGQSHTILEYRAFIAWQTSLFIVWPIGMVTAYLLTRKTKASGSTERQK